MKQLRLNQTIRNINCYDIEIPLVMTRLGVTGLKITGFAYLLDLFGGRGRRDAVISCMWSAFDLVNVGCVDVFFKYGESMVLVLRGVGNGYGI